MTNNSPRFLNLDSVEVPVVFQVQLNGRKHDLKPLSVKNYVANIRLVQELGNSPSELAQIEAIIKMLLFFFPTMTEDDLGSLNIGQLNTLLEAAKRQSGVTDVDEEVDQVAAENPLTAG